MPVRNTTFEALGTRWAIDCHDTLSDAAWQHLQQALQQRIAEFDSNYSRFRADSFVSRLAQKPGEYELPGDAHPMLGFYKKLYDATSGLVTPLIGSTMEDAGYDAGYSLKQKSKLRQPVTWEAALEYSPSNIVIKTPTVLDFGAAGKGYLVDILSAIMAAAGLANYVIDASGDIIQRSAQNETIVVGLENPFATNQAVGTVAICNRSLCASAGSKRAWGNFHHIINPNSLTPATHVAASWVIADSTMVADGLATALFFVAPSELQDFNFAYAILSSTMELEHSQDFPVQLFEARKA